MTLKDKNERIQDYEFLYYVITELLHELKFNKLSKHKMEQIIYSELVNYYHYNEDILTNKLTEYFKKSKLTKYFKKSK